MSIPALITKLCNIPSTTNVLEFKGPRFDKVKQDLDLRLPNTDQPSVIALAAFLTSVNISIFTDAELDLLSSIDFSTIENTSHQRPEGFTFLTDTSYYDVEGYVSESPKVFLQESNSLSYKLDLNLLLARNKNTNLKYLAVLLSNTL